MPNMVSLIVLPPTWNRANYQWLDDWILLSDYSSNILSIILIILHDWMLAFCWRGKKKGESVDVDLTFTQIGEIWGIKTIEQRRFTDDRLCWLTAVSGRMPSVATTANYMCIMQLHYCKHAVITLLNLGTCLFRIWNYFASCKRNANFMLSCSMPLYV